MKLVIYFTILLITSIALTIIIVSNKEVSLESSLKRFPKKFTLYKYSNGNIIEKKIVFKNDKEYIELLKILSDNIYKWHYKITTYTPKIYFVSPDITINLTENIIVVNDKSMFLQIIHEY